MRYSNVSFFYDGYVLSFPPNYPGGHYICIRFNTVYRPGSLFFTA
ncbi:hypothetical protein COXBURSA331_A0902 [Coxiella burnetii RSA 331]|nr:hypothetical protein COXBURSA331_A0902 [Coxiella burnetii RSA 331]EDR34981.1 hypothetical protein COXBURSA334_0943 [Coxiella burnetii Q321]